MGKMKQTLPDYPHIEYTVIGEPGDKPNELVQWAIEMAVTHRDERMTLQDHVKLILETYKFLTDDIGNVD